MLRMTASAMMMILMRVTAGFLKVDRLRLVRTGILSARGAVCQRPVLKVKRGEYVSLKKVCTPKSFRRFRAKTGRICGLRFVPFRMDSWIIRRGFRRNPEG